MQSITNQIVRHIDPQRVANVSVGPRPAWLDRAEVEADLTDRSNDETDPQNERNETVTGYFTEGQPRRLLGTMTEHERGFRTYHDRDEIAASWGEMTVRLVEKAVTPDQMGDEFPNGRFLS